MADHVFKSVFDAFKEEHEEQGRCIVRLSTSCWNDKNGIYVTKRLTYLKRKCRGYNDLAEECDNIGDADDVMGRVVNLYECEDGVYHVIVCNIRYDWESGYVDDYDFKLLPYEEEEE